VKARLAEATQEQTEKPPPLRQAILTHLKQAASKQTLKTAFSMPRNLGANEVQARKKAQDIKILAKKLEI